MGMLAKIRRMHLRDGMSLREVSRRTGLSRNTVRSWLRRPEVVEPKYPPRKAASKLDGWAEVLRTWLRSDSHRVKRERRTAIALFQAIRAQGYAGGYGRVCAFVRRWKAEEADAPKRVAYVPLAFELGEAFQFDWSCEYAFVGGLRRRLEVAHTKLAASRAFWLVAYPQPKPRDAVRRPRTRLRCLRRCAAPRHLRQHEDRGRSCRPRQGTHGQRALLRPVLALPVRA